MRRGLVPSWWSKPLKEMKLATFNARVETVAEKPIFRGAFQRTRCLIPASGYYEWHDASDGKQPYYSFTRSPALRAMTRYPSCLPSCSHSSPVGGCGADVGRHGAMKPDGSVR